MQKIKHFLENKDILIVIILILVGLISFYLGRLSYQEPGKGLKIQYNAQKANILESFPQNNPENTPKMGQNEAINPSIAEKANQAQGKYFASKIGHKYYPIGCSAGKNIKQENRIYFQDAKEAEKAGYELSASCR